jgi:rhodanese-related sulfurtransferase
MTRPVSPQEAQALLAQGAVLLDVREADEFARSRIPGARNLPLSRLDPSNLGYPGDASVIFHCQTGGRTNRAVHDLAAAGCETFILAGGLDAWQRAGLPVAVDRSQPLPIMR